MGNLYNKTNAPYLIAGTLATLVLLASGTLAVAPYVAFLSPIAAFNVALPVILTLFVLSAVVIAISCRMISQNKKLDEKEAELNEKNGLAKEQENTIQSLEPQIKGLNKKVSDLETKLDEISRQANGAATKDEVEELKAKIASAATKDEVEELKVKIASVATKEELNKLNNEVKELGTSAATKEGLNKKVSDLETKLDEISKQANGATTKGEMEELVTNIASAATKEELKAGLNGTAKKEELNKLSDEIKKLGTSAATKEGLNKKVSDLETKLDEISKQTNGAATKIGELKAGLNGAATKDEVEELKAKIASAATQEEINKLSNEVKELGTSAATKEGLNKKVSDLETKLDEISRQANGAATKDEVEELKAKIASAATKDEVEELKVKIASVATKEELNKLNNEVKELGTSAATKEGLNKKVSDLETKLDEISKQANGATTKGEMEELVTNIASAATKEELKAGLNGTAKKEELNKLSDEIKKLGTSAATKEGLNKKVSDLETKLDEISKQTNGAATKIGELKAGLNGAATKEELEERLGSLIKEVEVKEELQMKFYEKGKEREKITFEDIILPHDKKQELKKICEPQKESGAALKKEEGYILHGPPGTGKTMIAKAIASETKDTSAFISVSVSSLFNIKNINDLFKKAEENASCIVFIDEIEGFGKIRDLNGNNVEHLNHFLTKIDGFDSIKGVTVIAATNRISDLDEALTRGGRLSTHIKISTLDTNTRNKIINEHLKGTIPNLLKRVLDETKGFSHANLIILLRELEEKRFTSTSRLGEFCQHFKETHGIDNVLNKQLTKEKKLNKLEQSSLQETVNSLKMIKDLSSEHSPELEKINKGKFVNELPSSNYMSTPTTRETSTNETFPNLSKFPIVDNNSPNNLQGKKNPPRKSPEKEENDENKENSGPQNQNSPNSSLVIPNSSPLRNSINNSCAS
ncbi:AAA family ATPase [Wolbachia endosymbiont of Oedothorax gibbosus]|uniref:AAA family ATPase n=1 Tax=Wolbachia endosymbiont of Oedothorax gibbosus TaxID=931100 RepID=UPI0020249E12|nr:AAA family ATPase [Wolbachia endosymbiont of Oedothorax gibbosus]